MKRIIITLGLFALTISQSFAADPTVSTAVVKSFEARFANATDVSWSEADGYAIAAFTQNGVRRYAYYNQAAELVVVAQPITIRQLSEDLQFSLEENFSGYEVNELYKMKNEDGTRYYGVLKNKKESIIINGVSGEWEIVKKVKN